MIVALIVMHAMHAMHAKYVCRTPSKTRTDGQTPGIEFGAILALKC